MKFSGPIGFAVTEEVRPSIWQNKIVERKYRGDVYQRSANRTETNQTANDEINITNRISIVMDQFAHEHFPSIQYVVWMGTCWKVKTITVEIPRLTLEIGGIYNGERPDTTV